MEVSAGLFEFIIRSKLIHYNKNELKSFNNYLCTYIEEVINQL